MAANCAGGHAANALAFASAADEKGEQRRHAVGTGRDGYPVRREKTLYNSVTLSHDTLKKYFPKSYTAKQMEKVILKLLDNWLRSRQRSQER